VTGGHGRVSKARIVSGSGAGLQADAMKRQKTRLKREIDRVNGAAVGALARIVAETARWEKVFTSSGAKVE